MPITPAMMLSEQSSPVEESMGRMDSDYMAIERTLRYFRLRENQSSSLVDKTRCVTTNQKAHRSLQYLGNFPSFVHLDGTSLCCAHSVQQEQRRPFPCLV